MGLKWLSDTVEYDGPVYCGLEGDEPELVDEEYDEGEGR